MAYVVNGKRLADILNSGSTGPLESEFEIEDLISAIKDMKDKVKFLENLRKSRTSAIDAEIIRNEEKIDLLEKVISSTLEKVGKKSLNFPGIGKVGMSERKGKWVVNDEAQLITELEAKDKVAYDRVVFTKKGIAKKELDEILDAWEKVGNVPSCVSKDPPTKSLKVSFDANLVVDEEMTQEPEPFVQKTSETETLEI